MQLKRKSVGVPCYGITTKTKYLEENNAHIQYISVLWELQQKQNIISGNKFDEIIGAINKRIHIGDNILRIYDISMEHVPMEEGWIKKQTKKTSNKTKANGKTFSQFHDAQYRVSLVLIKSPVNSVNRMHFTDGQKKYVRHESKFLLLVNVMWHPEYKCILQK